MKHLTANWRKFENSVLNVFASYVFGLKICESSYLRQFCIISYLIWV